MRVFPFCANKDPFRPSNLVAIPPFLPLVVQDDGGGFVCRGIQLVRPRPSHFFYPASPPMNDLPGAPFYVNSGFRTDDLLLRSVDFFPGRCFTVFRRLSEDFILLGSNQETSFHPSTVPPIVSSPRSYLAPTALRLWIGPCPPDGSRSSHEVPRRQPPFFIPYDRPTHFFFFCGLPAAYLRGSSHFSFLAPGFQVVRARYGDLVAFRPPFFTDSSPWSVSGALR